MISSCLVCKVGFKYSPSNRSGKYCSRKCTYISPEWIEKQRLTKIGRTATEEARRKMSKYRKVR